MYAHYELFYWPGSILQRSVQYSMHTITKKLPKISSTKKFVFDFFSLSLAPSFHSAQVPPSPFFV
jgi:hypothetical protein